MCRKPRAPEQRAGCTNEIGVFEIVDPGLLNIDLSRHPFKISIKYLCDNAERHPWKKIFKNKKMLDKSKKNVIIFPSLFY